MIEFHHWLHVNVSYTWSAGDMLIDFASYCRELCVSKKAVVAHVHRERNTSESLCLGGVQAYCLATQIVTLHHHQWLLTVLSYFKR